MAKKTDISANDLIESTEDLIKRLRASALIAQHNQEYWDELATSLQTSLTGYEAFQTFLRAQKLKDTDLQRAAKILEGLNSSAMELLSRFSSQELSIADLKAGPQSDESSSLQTQGNTVSDAPVPTKRKYTKRSPLWDKKSNKVRKRNKRSETSAEAMPETGDKRVYSKKREPGDETLKLSRQDKKKPSNGRRRNKSHNKQLYGIFAQTKSIYEKSFGREDMPLDIEDLAKRAFDDVPNWAEYVYRANIKGYRGKVHPRLGSPAGLNKLRLALISGFEPLERLDSKEPTPHQDVIDTYRVVTQFHTIPEIREWLLANDVSLPYQTTEG